MTFGGLNKSHEQGEELRKSTQELAAHTLTGVVSAGHHHDARDSTESKNIFKTSRQASGKILGNHNAVRQGTASAVPKGREVSGVSIPEASGMDGRAFCKKGAGCPNAPVSNVIKVADLMDANST